MHIDKEIKNSEVKGKSLIFLSSNSEHNGTQNITGVLNFPKRKFRGSEGSMVLM